MDWPYLLQLTANGLVIGLLYALIGVGLALMFGVLRIINFAHGELLLVGAYAMALSLPIVGLSYIPGAIIAVIVTAALGFVLFQLFLSRLKEGELEKSILVTIGISIVVLYGIQYIFGATPRLVETELGFRGVELGTVRLSWTRVAAAAMAVASFVALAIIINRTQFGRAMRAIAQNREAALMVGIRPQRVACHAVVLAAALCGLAGAAIAPIQLVQPHMGQFLLYKAFAIIIIGGMGNIPGAAVAAIGLGLIESWIGGFFSIVWQETAGFVLMILILLVRPQGLFGDVRMRAG